MRCPKCGLHQQPAPTCKGCGAELRVTSSPEARGSPNSNEKLSSAAKGRRARQDRTSNRHPLTRTRVRLLSQYKRELSIIAGFVFPVAVFFGYAVRDDYLHPTPVTSDYKTERMREREREEAAEKIVAARAGTGLVVESWKLNAAGYPIIEGTVYNGSLRSFSYVEVTFKIYDSNNNVVGTAWKNQAGLGVGERWAFRIKYGDYGGPVRLVGVSGT